MDATPTIDIGLFANLRDRDLTREGLLVAEGRLVVERLLAVAGRTPEGLPSAGIGTAGKPELLGLVCPPPEEAEWQDKVAGRCPVLARTEADISGIAGFNFHRGVLAAARAPTLPAFETWWEDCLGQAAGSGSHARSPSRLVLCPDLNDAENLGSIYRCASALGWDGVGIGAACTSPFSRRVLRVSMGNCLRLPSFSLTADTDFSGLRRQGFVVVGTSIRPAARPLAELRQELCELARFNPPETPIRIALIFGNEFSGLRPEQEAACDRLVTIPMHGGTDSLNVAVAAGIFMHELGAGCCGE